jgi:tetratricopeptide (TPR) repeat protein
MRERLNILSEKSRPHLVPLLLLVLATAAVYGQSLGYDFLRNWDDNHYILENADVQGFGWDRIRAVFSTFYVGNYAPVQMLSYMLDYGLWGLHPGGFHLTNLLLHAANGLLLYRLLFRFIPDRLAVWTGTALFLLHPVQVETVVWISQRKNLLALFFFLIAWEFYLRFRESRSPREYAVSLVAVLAALLAKSVAVIFPVAMLLCDHCYPGERRGAKTVRDKAPYLLAALVAAVLAVLSQTPDPTISKSGGRTAYHGGSPLATLLTMLPVFCSYLRLIVWPTNLSALYDPPIRTSMDPVVLAAVLCLLGVGFLVYRLYRADRRGAFWPLFSCLALLPVAQIVPLVTLINDRYLYFPLIGVAGLLAFGIQRARAGLRVPPVLLQAGVAALLLVFALLSFARIDVWRSGITLWRDTVVKSPKLALAWEALGEANHYTARPDRAAAEHAYRQALVLSPASDISRYNLAVLYMDEHDYAKAEIVLRELLQRSPQHIMGLTAFGDLALHRADYGEAERRYRQALDLQPDAVQVLQKIGNLMVLVGRLDEARNALLKVEKLQGGYDAATAYDLARVEALAGDVGASVGWLEQALQRGYRNYDGILADEELTPVMSDARFATLVSRYFPRP